jgi:hypothetical protein
MFDYICQIHRQNVDDWKYYLTQMIELELVRPL